MVVASLVRRSVSECLGTCIFVFFIGMSRLAGSLHALVPPTVLVCLKFAFGHISLASLNPSLSIAFFVRGTLKLHETAAYCVSELLGGLLGALLACAFVTSADQSVVLSVQSSLGLGFLAELIGTFCLVTVGLNNTSADYEGNSFFGLSGGLILFPIILVFDGISGAAVNPSVGMLSLVAPIHGIAIPSSAWVYFVAPPTAGIIAAVVFRLLSPDDHAPLRFLLKGPVDHRLGTAPGSATLPSINDEP